MNKWINVKDKLPNELIGEKGISYLYSEDVLVTDEVDYFIANYDYESNKWDSEYCIDVDSFTYWTPLPELPKTRGNDE